MSGFEAWLRGGKKWCERQRGDGAVQSPEAERQKQNHQEKTWIALNEHNEVNFHLNN